MDSNKRTIILADGNVQKSIEFSQVSVRNDTSGSLVRDYKRGKNCSHFVLKMRILKCITVMLGVILCTVLLS